MEYAGPNDVKRRVGRPTTSSEEVLIEDWLADALRYIRRGFERRGLNLDTQVTAGDPAKDTVIAVQAQAVADRVRPFDPEGLTSVTKAIDDGSITKRREGPTPDTQWLTPDQWDEILPIAKAVGGAFTIRPSYAPDTCDTGPWVH